MANTGTRPERLVFQSLANLEGKEIIYRKGDYLFQAGEVPTSVIFVKQGRFRLENQFKRNLQGGIIHIFLSKKVWGLKEIFLNKPYILSAVADEPIICTQYDWELIAEQIQVNPSFRFTVIQMMAQEVEEWGQSVE